MVKELLRWGGPTLEFDVAVHLATLLVVLWAFRKEVLEIAKRPLSRKTLLVVIATIPTASMGLLVRTYFRGIFSSGILSSLLLILTGTLLWSTRRSKGIKKEEETSILDAFLVGVAQGLSTLPGLSRSGLTISMGILRGLDRKWAGEFSFLLAIPVFIGAGLLEVRSFQGHFLPIGIGMVGAFISGLISLKFLMRWLKEGKLYRFSFYCWGAGLGFLVYKLLLRSYD